MRKHLVLLILILGILWWGILDEDESFTSYSVIPTSTATEKKKKKEEEEEEEEEDDGTNKRDVSLTWKNRADNHGRPPASGLRETVVQS